MQSLSEHEAMRVLQAGAAMDATRATGPRPGALAAASSSWHPSNVLPPDDKPQTPSQALGDDVWKEMAEREAGLQKRHGDLDSWLDVFRATASSIRSAWKGRTEGRSYEDLAFGWLALARKHETAQCVPQAAVAEDLPLAGSPLEQWRCEATWAQAAYLAASREHLGELLGLKPEDLLAYEPEASDHRPAYFIAVHHDSRSVRLVSRWSVYSRALLTGAAGPSCGLGQGQAHGPLLSAAQSLLTVALPHLRAALASHPGYGVCFLGHSMGAGIAALMAIIVNSAATTPDPSQHGETVSECSALAAACPSRSVRATCFAPPPLVTVDLAEASVPYIDTVLYNADVLSRCSAVSLRRLANEVEAVKGEVMARNELAQILRHSGTLANPLVAAALCRCQPPVESGVAALCGAASPSPAVGAPSGGVLPPPSRLIAAPEGLGGLLARPPPAGLPPAAPPAAQCLALNGRPAQLASLNSTKTVTIATGVNGGTTAGGSVTDWGSDPHASAALATVAPVGPPSGTLPPLVTVGTANGRGGAGQDTPPRRACTDGPGVLSPPPLVQAAAAAASAHAVPLVSAAAVGPTPPRRGLIAVSHDGRQPPAVLAALGSYSEDGTLASFKSRADAGHVNLPDAPRPPPVVLPPVANLPPVSHPLGAMRTTGPGPLAEGTLGPDPTLLLPPVVLPPVSSTSPHGATCPPASCSTGPTGTMIRDWLPSTNTGDLHQLPHALSYGDLGSLPDKLPPPRHIAPLQPPILSDSSAVSLLSRQSTQHHRPGGLLGDELVTAAVAASREAGGARTMAATVDPKELLLPGCVYIIERIGADANATFRLLRDAGRTQINCILLKRSMLRDHLMGHYLAALERTLLQQQQQATGGGSTVAGTQVLSPCSTAVDVPVAPSAAVASTLT